MPKQPRQRATLASVVEDFIRYGNQTAVVYRDGLRLSRSTYGELATMSGRFAAELDRRGAAKGDRVLIWGENGAPWLAAFFGCLLRGVLAVPIDLAGTPEFARRVAHDVDAKLAVGSAPQVAQLDPETPRVDFEQFDSVLPREPLRHPIESLKEADPFQIIFTSGTTGDPKGVVHTHRNVLASLRPIEREMQPYMKYERIFHPLRFLHTLPLSHVFGQFMGLWIPTLFAAEVYFESRLSPAAMIAEIKESRISVVAAVPRVLDILRSHLFERIPDLEQRLRESEGASVPKRWWIFRDIHRMFGFKFWSFVAGGATLPPDLEVFWNSIGVGVIQGYGMTETAALVSLNHPFRAARGSIGKVLPGREIQIREDGEILVRGETVATAVWEGGELKQRESDWLETGDLAAVDETGNLHYRGRKKDVIVTASGLNIYPEDLEQALQNQHEVKAAAVIEVEGRSGPEPMAVLVLRAGGDPAGIVRDANRDLAEYQQIRRWAVWPEPDLPRNSTGKVLKREISRIIAAQGTKDGATHAAGGTLDRILHRITGEDVSNASDEALLSDLHIDSLGRVELQSSLETQFGIDINDDEWNQVKTLGDLRAMLRRETEGPAARNALQSRDRQGALPSQRHGAVPSGRRRAVASERNIYPTWTWSAPQQWIRAFWLETGLRFFVWLLAAPKVESHLRGEPAERVLIVSNHITAYDGAFILFALPRHMRTHVAIAMGGELLRDMRNARNQGSKFADLLAPFGYFFLLAWFNVFPLPQREAFRESYIHAGRAMDRGYHLLVFPEGGRTKDENMHEFRSGAGLLWKELRCPALPVFIGGLAEIKARKLSWFRSGRISVRVGTPITVDPNADAAEATRLLEAAVKALGG